ncbi:MAG: hypothetical protein NVSMB13_19880 [Mycobacteriales bacterium]
MAFGAVALVACGPARPVDAPADADLSSSYRAAPPPVTGIEGVAVASPGCPVERAGSPCPGRPLIDVSIQALDADSKQAGITTTDGQGHFRLLLTPGSYRLRLVSSAALPRCPEVVVVVPPDAVKYAQLNCDSGLR